MLAFAMLGPRASRATTEDDMEIRDEFGCFSLVRHRPWADPLEFESNVRRRPAALSVMAELVPGTSPAMTENGMESRSLPVCFSLAASRISGTPLNNYGSRQYTRHGLKNAACTLSPGARPIRAAVPPLSSSTAMQGPPEGTIASDSGSALAAICVTLPSGAMKTISNGM